MRNVTDLVWHYTATFDDDDIGAKEIDAMHKARGWSGIGYHFVIRLDGTIETGRPVEQIGAHVKNQNTGKIGAVTVGGLRRSSGGLIGVDTRNPAQIASQIALTHDLLERFPSIVRVRGHRDYMATQCPAYDVASWWAKVSGKPAARVIPVAADAPVVSYDMLKLGSRGDSVKALQTILNTKGFSAGIVDGIFGTTTDRAVRAFQLQSNIPADGKVGPVTWTTLYKGA